MLLLYSETCRQLLRQTSSKAKKARKQQSKNCEKLMLLLGKKGREVMGGTGGPEVVAVLL
jgi:hypothetical protein